MTDREFQQSTAQEIHSLPPEYDPSDAEIRSLPQEIVPPAAESAPPPQEFSQTPLISDTGDQRSLRRLLTSGFAALLIVCTSLSLMGDRTETPVSDMIGQVEAVLPELQDAPVEDVSEPADPYAGMTDAEVLVTYSPWTAGDISCTFLKDGTGFWAAGSLFGQMTWSETVDGRVAYEGHAVLFNASFSGDSGKSSSIDANELNTAAPDEIYYADTSVCSGMVSLDRFAGTAALDSPISPKLRVYRPSGSEINGRLAALASIPAETLRCGSWEASDGLASGIRSLDISADGTAAVSVNGVLLKCQMDLAGRNGEDWIHIFNTETGGLRVDYGGGSWLEISNGLQVIIGVLDSEPVLVFYDATADGSFSYRVFTRPDLDRLPEFEQLRTIPDKPADESSGDRGQTP